MADAYIVIGADGIDEIVGDNGAFSYSSYNQNGASPSGTTENYMKKKGTPNINVGDGTMLIQTLIKNANNISNEINKTVGKLDQLKNVTSESLLKQVTETAKLSTNIKTALGDLNLSVGANGIEMNKQTQAMQETAQANKKVGQLADKKLEHLHFEETGEINGSQLIDSQGKAIKPIEAKARANAEQSISKSLENRIPYGDIVDDSDDINDDDNIMKKVLSDLVNIDISKIHDIDNKIGVNNG